MNMAEPRTDDDDFLDLCDESSLPKPTVVGQSRVLSSDGGEQGFVFKEETLPLEDYSDLETEDDSHTKPDKKNYFSNSVESVNKKVILISDESDTDISKPKTDEQSEKSHFKRRSGEVYSSENSPTKKVKHEGRFDVFKNIGRKNQARNFSHRKERLENIEYDSNHENSMAESKTNFVQAAIKLKELFPDISASKIGEMIEKVNYEHLSENGIIQSVVELICSSPDNKQDNVTMETKHTYSDDVQIALANPKLQVSQNEEYTCTVISKAKNHLSNRAKGKGIVKKVATHTDEVDVEMDIDRYVDPAEVEDLTVIPSPVSRPEIVVKTKLNAVKLRWTLIDTPKFSSSDINLRYIIEIQAPPCEDWNTLARNVAGNVYEVSNLKPKQDYQFRVRASTKFGEISGPSPVVALCRSIGNQISTHDQEETFDIPEPQKLDNYPWFHGNVSRDEADQHLFEGTDGQYFVRMNDKGTLCLSLHSNGGVKHYRITEEPDEQVYIERAVKFRSVPELISHYIHSDGLASKLKESLSKDKDAENKSKSNTSGQDVIEVSSTTLKCEGCGTMATNDKIVQCCDGHLNCNTCVEKVVKKILSVESEEVHTNITCCYEASNCASYIPESQAKKVLPSLIFELLEDKLNKLASEAISKMEDVFSCPSCTNKFVIEDDIKQLYCTQCQMTTCRYCQKKWDSTSHNNCSINKMMISSNEMEISSDWCTVPDGYQDFIAVNVPTESKEFQFVSSMFRGDKGLGCRNTVRNIYHIRNPRLWQKYSLMKDHMKEDIGNDSLNELHLFHGTNTCAVGGICRDGLDWRMCGVNGTVYGQGTYFAKNSKYSMTYCLKGRGHSAGRISSNLNIQIHSAVMGGLGGFGYAGPSTNQTGPLFGAGQNITASNNQVGTFMFGVGQTNTGLNVNQQGPFVFGVGQTNTASNNNQQGPFVFGGGQTNTALNVNQQGPYMFGVSQTSTSSNNQAGTLGLGVSSNKPTFGVAYVNNLAGSKYNFGTVNHVASSNPRLNGRNSVTISKRKRRNEQQTEIPLEELFIDSDLGYMFLARVLVGRPCQGKHGLRKPPRDDNNKLYNSACDKPNNPSIFVIFDSAQCYPEYLIEFA